MNRVKTYIIITLLTLVILKAFVEVMVNLKEEVVSESSNILWSLSYIILVVMWAQRDAIDSKKQYPFEYGFLIYLLWPILLPYHLINSRGAEGAILLLGFIAVYLLPFFSGLVAYMYFS